MTDTRSPRPPAADINAIRVTGKGCIVAGAGSRWTLREKVARRFATVLACRTVVRGWQPDQEWCAGALHLSAQSVDRLRAMGFRRVLDYREACRAAGIKLEGGAA